MNLEPTFDNLVIERDDLADKSPGGIVLVKKGDDKAKTGKVLAAGPGRIKQGVFQKQSILVGDRVLFRAYGTVHEVDGKTVFILNQDEILAVIK